jgi:hypothetical protein
MHFLSFLIVKADSREEAVRKARNFLEQYQDQVWDWYVIGGRWSGFFTQRRLDQATYEKFLEEFRENGLGMISKDNPECKQRKRSHELFMKYFPNFEGDIPVYRDPYLDDGYSDDVVPLGCCEEIIQKYIDPFHLRYGELVERAKKEIESDGTISRSTAWELGRYAYDDNYSTDHTVFNVEDYSVSIPDNPEGYYVVTVDLHS